MKEKREYLAIITDVSVGLSGRGDDVLALILTLKSLGGSCVLDIYDFEKIIELLKKNDVKYIGELKNKHVVIIEQENGLCKIDRFFD